MASVNIDLTGTNENFLVSNRIFKVFRYGQVIDFGAPVYADSIKVYLISGAVKNQMWSIGEEFTIPDELVQACDNDMSRAKIADSTFNSVLTSGIQCIKGVDNGASFTIAVSYQGLYPNQLRTPYLHNEPFALTPEVAYYIVQSLQNLEIITNRVVDVTTLESGESILLELDEIKANINNYIENEEHNVDVPNGRFIIHPKGGAFYEDSVTVKVNGEALVKNKDYFIVGMDTAKTKATSHTAAVYKFIMVVASITGSVEVSYHAFGGDPTLDNYREVLSNVNNITQYLRDAKHLTTDNLGHTEVMTSLLERVETLEEKMRRLQGLPKYGDVTSGKSIVQKIFAPTTGLHWYTIAKLYLTNGVDMSPCTADTFMFRLQTQMSHIQLTAVVSVDLSNNELDRFNMNVLSDNYPRGYVPFTDYRNAAMIRHPQFRIVWSEGDAPSGCYLQFGFDLTGMTEETVAIEDLSGHESCWQLVDETSEVTTPTDDSFLLPSGDAWDKILETSKQESMLVPFKKGHLVWAGCQPMNLTQGWWYFECLNHYLEKSTDIRRIQSLRLSLEERNGLQFVVDVPFNVGLDHLSGHASFTYQDQPAYINAEIYRNQLKEIVIRVNYSILGGTDSNELDIRDMSVLL